MTTAHLNELTAQQVRATADTRSATAGAVSAVVAVRRSAGMKIADLSDDLGRKLADAAQRYDQSDDAMGRALDGQVPG